MTIGDHQNARNGQVRHRQPFKMREMHSQSSRGHAKTFLTLVIVLASMSALAQMSDWRAPPSVANRPNPVPVNATTIELGKKLFVANCLTCHGAEGHGDGPGAAALEKKPADLPKRIKETGEKDGELFWKISEGRAPMVTWKTQLSETQRWELVNYIRATIAK
jgi:mono/diheme cytochrome c family protein